MFSEYCTMKNLMKKKDDDYKVGFSGATISKKDSNIAGLGLLFGAVGAVFSLLVFGSNKPAAFLIITICVVAGVIVANKIFEK